MLYLLTENPEGARSTVPLQPDDCLFAGSGSGCHIKLSGDDISAIHCVVWMDSDGAIHVQDRGVTGKTTLNGQPIDIAFMQLEDEIKIGNYRLSISTVEIVEPEVATPDVASSDLAASDEVSDWDDHDILSTPREIQEIAPLVNDAQEVTPLVNDAQEPAQPVSDAQDIEQLTDPTIYNVQDSAPVTDEFQYIASEMNVETPGEGIGFDAATPALDEGWHFDDADEESAESSFENEPNFHENEMLRMEVEQLRSELAQRSLHDGVTNPDNESHSTQATERLVLRLEELLDELQNSDDRIQQLEELLRLSDSATQAEQQERKQLESWVAGIEDRVCQKEAESVAELEQANQLLQFAQTRIRDLEAGLEKVINASEHHDATAVKEFQQQLERAQKQHQQAVAENLQLKSQLEERSDAGRSQAEFDALEEKLLQLEVAKSRERAEMARQRVEMERMMHEIESKSKSQIDLQDADTRVRAMRLHLRDIHDQEQQEKKERSLGTRISQLFSRTKLNK